MDLIEMYTEPSLTGSEDESEELSEDDEDED